MTLDTAWTDEVALIARLEEMLGGRVHQVKIRRVDFVEATTSVEVRYELASLSAGSTRVIAGSVGVSE